MSKYGIYIRTYRIFEKRRESQDADKDEEWRQTSSTDKNFQILLT